MPTLADFRGLAVRLTEERLAHVLEHPEMRGLESAIAETLGNPQAVTESRGDPQVQLYYRLYNHPRLGEKYLCVVVKTIEPDAFVLTAYLTDRVKQGEPLWPRSS